MSSIMLKGPRETNRIVDLSSWTIASAGQGTGRWSEPQFPEAIPPHEPLPYYKWLWKDRRATRKVQRMSWQARGLCRELLDEFWVEGNYGPQVIAMPVRRQRTANEIYRERT